jgi:hypothetical protein
MKLVGLGKGDETTCIRPRHCQARVTATLDTKLHALECELGSLDMRERGSRLAQKL